MTLPTRTAPHALIGVFDSGVGGLSVLRALHAKRPDADLHYIADSAHAPYGDRDAAHVIERSICLTDHLVQLGADMVVVACNTATAWAIEHLRQRHPRLLLVGVEPGVKPAAASSPGQRIGVMATPGTLASARFASLVARHAGRCRVTALPCPGLAAAIEQGQDGHAEVDRLLDGFCEQLRQAQVDTVVLGCTHYPFVAARIALRLPQVQLIDTADAVATQALRLRAAEGGRAPDRAPQLRLQSTGDTAVLERLAREGLGLAQTAEYVQL